MLAACRQVFPPEQLEQLMAKSDYVVAALPATPATNKLVSAAAIAALQPHAVFVNLGRGATVDEEALIAGEPAEPTLPGIILLLWMSLTTLAAGFGTCSQAF